MDKRTQTCCFTGHRHLPAGEEEAIWQRVQEHLIPLLEQGVRYFGVGGALGFDTLVAEKLLELRGQYPQIRVILVLPFHGYQSLWTAPSRPALRGSNPGSIRWSTAAPHPAVRPFWPATGIWWTARPTASVTVRELPAVRRIRCGMRRSRGYKYGMSYFHERSPKANIPSGFLMKFFILLQIPAGVPVRYNMQGEQEQRCQFVYRPLFWRNLL